MSRRSPPSSASLGREKRHQATVAIRKKGRDSRVAAERTAGNNPAELPLTADELQQLRRFGIPQLLEDFRSGTPALLRATMATRKLLSVEREADGLADKMVALGLINELCLALDRHDSPRLQFEAIWGLTNAAILRPEVVVRAGALPKIVNLLDVRSVPVKEQSLWSLGNIMSKSSAYRNQCLALGALQKIRALLMQAHGMTNEQHEEYAKANEPEDFFKSAMNGISAIPISRGNFIRQASWALSNAIRGGDVDEEYLREITRALPVVRDLVLNSDDPNVVANTLWTIADYSEVRPRQILELGICDRILELGLHSHRTVQAAASQTISNMCSGDPQGLRALMLARRGDLVLTSHLRSERTELWVTASWSLSYACSELSVVCDRLLSQCNVFLDRLAHPQTPTETRQDCAAIVSDCFLTDAGTEVLRTSEKPLQRLLETLEDGGIERDVDLAGKVVQCTINLLRRGGRDFARLFEENGGFTSLRRIEHSQAHSSFQQATPLSIALEQLDNLFEDNEDEQYNNTDSTFAMHSLSDLGGISSSSPSLSVGQSSPQRYQSLARSVQQKGKVFDRVTFQAFMKD